MCSMPYVLRPQMLEQEQRRRRRRSSITLSRLLLNIQGTAIHVTQFPSGMEKRTERMMPALNIPTTKTPKKLPPNPTVHSGKLNMTDMSVGNEPIIDAGDSIRVWMNGVWVKFLGYGTALCILIMLLFCMVGNLRRTIRTSPPRPSVIKDIEVHFSSHPSERPH